VGAFAAGLLATATMLGMRASPSSGDVLAEDGPVVAASVARGARAWPRCPECGVIESVREIVPADGVDTERRAASSSTTVRSLPATDDQRSTRYEVTVRFRDGTTTMFDVAKPHTWRLGSRVNVIVGAAATAP